MHETTRSKKFLQIFTCLGVGVSYDQVKRQDQFLVSRTFARAQDHCASLPPCYEEISFLFMVPWTNLIMRNKPASGIEGSHDTVLVLFQHNFGERSQTEQGSLENVVINAQSKVLENVLLCQQLTSCNKPKQ